jgi:hypothetical protein
VRWFVSDFSISDFFRISCFEFRISYSCSGSLSLADGERLGFGRQLSNTVSLTSNKNTPWLRRAHGAPGLSNADGFRIRDGATRDEGIRSRATLAIS